MTNEIDLKIAAAVTAATAGLATATAAANAAVATDISYIKRDINEIKESVRGLSTEYVTKAEFAPIQKIVWGVVTVLGLATMSAILKLILVK